MLANPPLSKGVFHTAALAALLAISGLLISGCAAREVPDVLEAPAPEAPIDWQMSLQAEASYLFLVFDKARSEQDGETATQALERLLEIDPSPRVFMEGANYHWRQGRLAEARSLLKQGIQRFPGHKSLNQMLATTYLAEKRYDDAALTLQDYLAANPDDHEARQELAAILIEGKRHAEALDLLETAPEEDRDATLYFFMAKARTGLGLTQKAIDDLKAALEMNPKFVEAWAELAFLYEMEKDFVSAEEIYARILELGETGREVWLRLINLNIKLNNPDKAMAYYRQGPDDTDFALETATFFLDEKFYDQAESILNALVERGDAPDKVNFYMAVLAYEGYEDARQAIDYLERIPDDDPRQIQSLRFRIQLHMELEEYDEAIELTSQGRERFPDSESFAILESRIYEEIGELDQALQILDDASAKWPEDTGVLYSMGSILDKMDKHDEAIEVMEKIITIDPENADALNFLGYSLADLNRDMDRALVLVRKALELKPDSGYIVDSLAWVYFRMGRLEQAWDEINKAVDMVQTDPVIWEHYGDIAGALGKKAQARKGYLKSLEIKPDNQAVQLKLEALGR